MSLVLDNVSYTYGIRQGYSIPALAGVSLELAPGSLTVLVGATGSGKSTLLRLAAGLLVAGAGRISIDGAPLTAEVARGRVGLVFQDAESQLFADTVLEDIAFGPRNLGASDKEARQAAGAALDRVGLPSEDFGARSPFSLSGGEARRVAIAGVLAMRPDYLLADEPTAGLDARGRRAVREILLGERERSGVLVVTHAAEEFLAYADRLVVLCEGAVAWTGSPEEVVRDPESFVRGTNLRLSDVLEVQRQARSAGLMFEPALDAGTAAERILSAKRADA